MYLLCASLVMLMTPGWHFLWRTGTQKKVQTIMAQSFFLDGSALVYCRLFTEFYSDAQRGSWRSYYSFMNNIDPGTMYTGTKVASPISSFCLSNDVCHHYPRINNGCVCKSRQFSSVSGLPYLLDTSGLSPVCSYDLESAGNAGEMGSRRFCWRDRGPCHSGFCRTGFQHCMLANGRWPQTVRIILILPGAGLLWFGMVLTQVQNCRSIPLRSPRLDHGYRRRFCCRHTGLLLRKSVRQNPNWSVF